MKKVYYGLLSFFFVGLVSCTKDEPQSSLEGRIDVKVSTDQTLLGEASRSGEEKTIPDINDFGLTIESLDGKVFNSWESFSEFRPVSVAIGTYTVTASYGDVEAEGFDAISYQGSTNVEVRKEETAEASVTCIINKAKVSINYTDEFKSYFTSYSSYISSSKGNKVTFSANESQGAYFVPGSLGVYLEVTRQGVSQKVTLNPKNFTAEAKHEYRLTMDVDASTASLKITFNDNPSSEQNVEINISDEALNADPPVFTPHGFTSGNTLKVLEGAVFSDKLEAYLNASAGLAKCELVTHSVPLKEQGWPESVDLMNLTTEQSQKMTALGLQTKGLGVNHDKIALIDFQQLVPNLTCTSENNEVHTFTLRATDALTKVSEELKLVIETRNNGFAVELPETVPYASTSVTFTLTLEGDVSKVKFYYDLSDTGVYQPFDAEKVQITSENTKHTVTLTYPESLTDTEHDVKLKAEFGVKVIEKSFKIEDPELTLSLKNGDADVWATKAYLQVEASAKSRASRTISSSTVEIQYKEGEKWKEWPNQSYNEETGLFLLTKMGEGATETEGVSYTLRAVYKRGGEIVSISDELNVTTEAKAQVGNAGFEDWYSEMVWEKSTFGGKKIYSFYPYLQGGLDKWWSTTNALTTQAKGDFSWYYAAYASVIPTNATETHTASWHVKQYGNASDFGVGEITESMLDKSNSGSTAMEIATVGWGKNNWTSQGQAQSNCQTRSAGCLFIGTYDVNTGMNLGHLFKVRPSALCFAYKYYPYQSDVAKVYITVYNGDTSIGYGELLIDKAVPQYKTDDKVFIKYTDLTKQATKLTIVFMSSNSETPQTIAIQGYSGWDAAFKGYGDSRHIGSILTVDDVKLIYE